MSPENYIYASKLTVLGINKLKTQDFKDAKFLLEKAYTIIQSPNILLHLAKSLQGIGDIKGARKVLIEFKKRIAVWNLTVIKKSTVLKVLELFKIIENSLIKLTIKTIPVENVQIYINGKEAGLTPLKEPIIHLPGVIRITLLKKGYLRKEIQIIEKRGGLSLLKEIKLVTREEELKRTKLFKETETKRRIAQIKLMKEKRTKLNGQIDNWKKVEYIFLGLLIAGTVSSLSGIIIGGLSFIPSSRLDEASKNTPWKSVEDDYNLATTMRQTSAVLTVIGLFTGAVSWYFYDTSRKKITHLKSSLKKQTTISFSPVISPEISGIGISASF